MDAIPCKFNRYMKNDAGWAGRFKDMQVIPSMPCSAVAETTCARLWESRGFFSSCFSSGYIGSQHMMKKPASSYRCLCLKNWIIQGRLFNAFWAVPEPEIGECFGMYWPDGLYRNRKQKQVSWSSAETRVARFSMAGSNCTRLGLSKIRTGNWSHLFPSLTPVLSKAPTSNYLKFFFDGFDLLGKLTSWNSQLLPQHLMWGRANPCF